eukprot:NODE_3923_length_1260_cov_206.904134_g3442_i0.p1 GENE.NODE_3923_length_1260_cov_206.904134_g3442_i0~~NODE_3923_length_1260_cov_206.904134_g3442_i0.p1  ORF type:complete len:355 (-),score=74.63 NODE_3923_length_1260_cov_206.904134_g3442_i0:135-1199(-)
MQDKINKAYKEQNKTQKEELLVKHAPGEWVSPKVEEKLHPELKGAASPPPSKPKESLGEILTRAGKRALGGGIPGAVAMVAQVSALMWLRTTMNYQYRHGTSMTTALKTLYKDGGVVRFYRGYFAALAQGPLSRFGDTAANSGMLALLESYDATKNLPVSVKTVSASAVAAAFRLFLMPIDTVKTIMQVEGKNGFPALMAKARKGGVPVFFHGSMAAAGATFIGHFPWFYTHNVLDQKLPKQNTLLKKLLRNATIGFCSSVVSDVCSNSVRVIKTTKQTSATVISYPQALKMVLESEGYKGLFLRGLTTRIAANACQGMLFTVVWKGLEEELKKREVARLKSEKAKRESASVKA